MKTERTKVIFRKFKEGDVVALFTQEPGTYSPYTCSSYMHIGQHSSADPLLSNILKLATPAEYRDLAKELRRIGYRLDICKRSGQHDLAVRRKELEEMK